MDLSNIAVLAQEGEWMPVTLPGGTQVIAELLVLGRDSSEVKEATNKQAIRIAKSRGIIDPEKTEKEILDGVITCVKAWRDPATGKDVLLFNGEELVCNYANKKMLFERLSFIPRQVDSFMADDSNFFKL